MIENKSLTVLEVAFIQNTINELNNQITKDAFDSFSIKSLCERAINKIQFLLTHIGYVETATQLQETIALEWKQLASTFYKSLDKETLDHYQVNCFCQTCVAITTYRKIAE